MKNILIMSLVNLVRTAGVVIMSSLKADEVLEIIKYQWAGAKEIAKLGNVGYKKASKIRNGVCKMKKSIVAIMMAVTLVGSSLAFPVQAYAEDKDYVYDNEVLPTNDSESTVKNNHGTVTNNRGTVENNDGKVVINNGTVASNNGTVTNNYGEGITRLIGKILNKTTDAELETIGTYKSYASVGIIILVVVFLFVKGRRKWNE